jgi:6-phosphogluconolactonase
MTRLMCGWLALCCPALAAAAQAWVGTYTTDGGQTTGSVGIYALDWDARTGHFGLPHQAAATSNPSFLAADPTGRRVFAVNENGSANDQVSSFLADPGQPGDLVANGSVPSGGSAPCHLLVDQSGHWLFVANYLTGTLAVLPIHDDGSLGEPKQVVQQTGSGSDYTRQQSAHAHQVLQSDDGGFVLAIDLGADKVYVYRFDSAAGHLTPTEAGPASLPPGYGPRHAVFARDRRNLYVVTELVPAVVTFRWDAATGALVRRAITPVLPKRFQHAGSGAEIVLHPGGEFLYVSHRGDTNTISSFRIGADRIPRRTGIVSSGGIKPRYIGLDPSGRYLVAAHQTSGDLRVFRIDAATGRLHLLPGRTLVPGAVMVLFSAADTP